MKYGYIEHTKKVLAALGVSPSDRNTLAEVFGNKDEQETKKETIKQEFDRIFTQKTEYFQLNACLGRTLKNRDKLLAVLENSALPLHNTSAELEARRIVRNEIYHYIHGPLKAPL